MFLTPTVSISLNSLFRVLSRAVYGLCSPPTCDHVTRHVRQQYTVTPSLT